MQFESIYPFLLIIAPFAASFLLEAIVIYLFRLKRFGRSLLLSIGVNLVTLLLLYVSTYLLSLAGYAITGLVFPLQIVLFFWWLSIVVDGILLQIVTKEQSLERVYSCAVLMNTVSYLFLYFFIINTQ